MWRNVKNICKQCGGAVGLTCAGTLIILQADYNEDAPVNNKIVNTTLFVITNKRYIFFKQHVGQNSGTGSVKMTWLCLREAVFAHLLLPAS